MLYLIASAVVKLVGMAFVFAHIEWARVVDRETAPPCARVIRR